MADFPPLMELILSFDRITPPEWEDVVRQLEQGDLEVKLKIENVKEIVEKSPKMWVETNGSISFDHFWDIDTIYHWFDQLESR